ECQGRGRVRARATGEGERGTGIEGFAPGNVLGGIRGRDRGVATGVDETDADVHAAGILGEAGGEAGAARALRDPAQRLGRARTAIAVDRVAAVAARERIRTDAAADRVVAAAAGHGIVAGPAGDRVGTATCRDVDAGGCGRRIHRVVAGPEHKVLDAAEAG